MLCRDSERVTKRSQCHILVVRRSPADGAGDAGRGPRCLSPTPACRSKTSWKKKQTWMASVHPPEPFYTPPTHPPPPLQSPTTSFYSPIHIGRLHFRRFFLKEQHRRDKKQRQKRNKTFPLEIPKHRTSFFVKS